MGLRRESIGGVLRFAPVARCRRMSYPWTRVPAEPPPLDPLQRRLLPVADLFMALMLSRPGGLSLRTTWVTPATIWLSGAACALVGVASIAAVIVAAGRVNLLLAAAGLLGLLLAAGTGVVALYGIRQRLLARRDPGQRVLN